MHGSWRARGSRWTRALWDQIERLARVLGSAHEALHTYVLTQAVLGADETRWRMLDGKGRDVGVSKHWQVWVLAAPDAVVYRIEDSRSTDAAKNVLGGFAGIAMADGYGAYEALAKRGGGFVVAHCWAPEFGRAPVPPGQSDRSSRG